MKRFANTSRAIDPPRLPPHSTGPPRNPIPLLTPSSPLPHVTHWRLWIG